MTQQPASSDKTYRAGEIIYRQGELTMTMYDVLWGHVAVYVDYGLPTQILLNEVDERGFVGIVGFLECRQQNTTAVATEETMVSLITRENFGRYFQERPAKVMSIMQYMSGRMRALTRAYLDACQALEQYADTEKLKAEKQDWYDHHISVYQRFLHLFGADD